VRKVQAKRRRGLFENRQRPKQDALIRAIRKHDEALARRVKTYINRVRHSERYDMGVLGRTKKARNPKR